MLDIQFIRENKDLVKEKSKQKGYDIDVDKLLNLDDRRRKILSEIEHLQRQRNELSLSASVSVSPSSNEEESTIISVSDEQKSEGRKIKEQISAKDKELEQISRDYKTLLKAVPNMPLKDVPIGKSEDENVVAKTEGDPTKFDFEPKNHAQIAEAKGWLDKERAAKVTGARFAYLKGDMVKLQFAIVQMIIDKLTDSAFLDKVIKENNLKVSNKPFMPVLPPLMLKTSVYDAMDRLEPIDERYKIETDDLWLQGSAEHVMGSMHADEILAEADLPIRYLGYATSFRREAGTYGKDMEGIFRMHQFDKLEMESLTTAETGLDEHLFLIAIQEKLMQLLEIPYQLLNKCTADIGKPNARGVDINAWLPGQGKYRETHTADYMTNYQARRLKTRVRSKNGEIQLVHTNDATAMALSRGPIAIIENYQTKDGDVKVPDVLKPYMSNKEII